MWGAEKRYRMKDGTKEVRDNAFGKAAHLKSKAHLAAVAAAGAVEVDS